MSAEAVSPMIRRWRLALGVVGVSLLVVGGIVVLAEIPPTRYAGILLWLGAALVIHDGIAAMAVLAVSIGLRKAGRRIPLFVVLVVQGALAVASIITLVVVPEIVKQAIGTANPSVLPLNYAASLLASYGVLAAIAALLIAVMLGVRAARRR